MRELKPQMQSTKGLEDTWARKIREHYIPELDLNATVKGAFGITSAYKELMLKIAKKAKVYNAWIDQNNLRTLPIWEKSIELAAMDVVYAQHLSRFTRPSMRDVDTQLDEMGPRALVSIIVQEMQLAIQLEPKYERAFAVAITDTNKQTFNLIPVVFPTIGIARQEAQQLRIQNDNESAFQIIDLKMIWEEDGYEN